MNDNVLFTHCPSGLYRVNYDRSEVQQVESRKTGRTYLRLLVRFAIESGPWVHDPKTHKLTARQMHYKGRVIPIFQELGVDDGGHPTLSPNAWFAGDVLGREGDTLAERLDNWGRSVQWVGVHKPDKGPAKVSGLVYTDAAPSQDWAKQFGG